MSQPIDRRAFMHRAAGASAAVSLSLAGPLTRQVLGANDRVRVGVIGTGRQGALQPEGVQEPRRRDRRRVRRLRAEPREGQGRGRRKHGAPTPTSGGCSTTRRSTSSSTPRPTTGTPCPSVMACQAGKDVFVEKPVSVAGRGRQGHARRRPQAPARRPGRRSGSAPTSTSSRPPRSSARGSSARSRFVRTWNYSQRVSRTASATRRTPIRPPGSTGTCGSARRRRSPSTPTASVWATAGPPSATSGTTRTACSATGPCTSSTSCSGPSTRPGPR